MSDDTIHTLESFSKTLTELDLHLKQLLRLLDTMDTALYQSRSVYRALQGISKRVRVED